MAGFATTDPGTNHGAPTRRAPFARHHSADRLRRVQEAAVELGASDIFADAEALARRVTDGIFYVAVVGQFKRGKSTLINALIGRDLLPTGIVPVTAVITVVRYGEEERATVTLRHGTTVDVDPRALEPWVSEELNPENRRNVAVVEVRVPAALLRNGMALVDTPGLGSVFDHNAATTRAFIPHVDAAIVVTGIDPPISGDELSLIETLGREVADLVVVLNKADKAADAEQAQANTFASRVVAARLRRPIGRLLRVSALAARSGAGDSMDFAELTQALVDLSKTSGAALVRAASERGTRRLVRLLVREIDEATGALTRPLAESESRVAALQTTLGETEQALLDLRPLLAAEQSRLSQRFAERRKAFLASAVPSALSDLHVRASAIRGLGRRAYRGATLDAARNIARQAVLPWLDSEQLAANAAYAQATQRFADLARDLITRMVDCDAERLGDISECVDPTVSLTSPPRFRFTDLEHGFYAPSAMRAAFGMALGGARARRQAVREASELVERLLDVNSDRVQNDLRDRVSESRNAFERAVRSAIARAHASATRALDAANETRRSGEDGVRARVTRLDQLRAELVALTGDPTGA